MRIHSVPWKSRDEGVFDVSRLHVLVVVIFKQTGEHKTLTSAFFCSSSLGIARSSTGSSANAGVDGDATTAAAARNAVPTDTKDRREDGTTLELALSAWRAKADPEGLAGGAMATNADAMGRMAIRVVT